MDDTDAWLERKFMEEDAVRIAKEAFGIETMYLNKYECAACEVGWEDEWSCGCDDECPRCGQAISPYDSTEI